MGMIYDGAMWASTLVEQMGMWAFLPFILGAGLVGLKIKQLQ